MAWHTVDQAAEIMGFSKNTVLRFIESKELRAARFGEKLIRISGDDIKTFYDTHETIPRPDLSGV